MKNKDKSIEVSKKKSFKKKGAASYTMDFIFAMRRFF